MLNDYLNDYIKGIWFTKDLLTYVNFGTGEKIKHAPEKNENYIDTIRLSKSSVNVISLAYLTNDEDGNLIMHTGLLDVKCMIRGKAIRSFQEERTYKITSSKNIYIKIREYDSATAYEEASIRNIPMPAYIDYWIDSSSIPDRIAKTFKSPIYFCGNNNFGIIDNYYNLYTFLKHKESTRKNGPKQKLIDELAELTPSVSIKDKLSKLKEENRLKSSYQFASTYSTIIDVNKIEGYKEPCCCIRSYVYDPNTDTESEGSRIYVTKSNYIVAKKNNFGEFITATAQYPSYWNHPMLPLDKDICKGTKLEYFNEIANDVPESQRMHLVFLCLQQPIIEQLYKAGYKNIVETILEALEYGCISNYNSFFTELSHYKANKNFYKALDMNKYQLSIFDDLCEKYKTDFKEKDNANYSSLLYSIRTRQLIISTIQNSVPDSISFASLDNKTFWNLVNIFSTKDKFLYYYRNIEIVKLYIELYGIESFNAKIKFIQDVFAGEYDYMTTYTFWDGSERTKKVLIENMFYDYLNMVKTLEAPHLYKVNFTNGEQVTSAHDNLVALITIKETEQLTEQFHTSVEKLNKYAYKSDDYSVVIPKEPEDLAVEGITLHHCVKSYIKKVAEGTTGIVFIRENSDLTKPFFTVEVQKGMVMQVHGFGNCNVEDPELMKFIKDWTSKKSLKLYTIGKGINMVR